MAWLQSDINYVSQSYVPCEWSTGTDAEIVEALEKHYAGEVDLKKYWSVGDERTVSLSAMEATGVDESHAAQDVIFVLSNVGGKYLSDGVTECAFQIEQKNCLNETGYINSTATNSGGWKDSERRTWCNSIYKDAIPSTLRSVFKEFINQSGQGGNTSSGVYDTIDIFALRAEIEIRNVNVKTVSGEGSQVKWYETASNRIKQVNGNNYKWWERSTFINNSERFCYVNSEGICGSSSSNSYADYCNTKYGIAPFGVI